MRGERPKYSDEEMAAAPEKFVELMRACWSTDEDARPTFKKCQKRLRTILNSCQQQQNGDKAMKRKQTKYRITAMKKDIKQRQAELEKMEQSLLRKKYKKAKSNER